MARETNVLSDSGPPVIRRAGPRISLWLVAPLVLAAAGGSGYLGAWWAAHTQRSELILRPPVVLFDMAGAVQGVDAAQLGASVARAKEQAKRLAEGGFIVLDAQAVIAAPPELYLAPMGDVGDAPR